MSHYYNDCLHCTECVKLAEIWMCQISRNSVDSWNIAAVRYKTDILLMVIFFIESNQSNTNIRATQLDGLVQERHSSIAKALELRLFCTNPSNWGWCTFNILLFQSRVHTTDTLSFTMTVRYCVSSVTSFICSSLYLSHCCHGVGITKPMVGSIIFLIFQIVKNITYIWNIMFIYARCYHS